jgi:hypothetical protein
MRHVGLGHEAIQVARHPCVQNLRTHIRPARDRRRVAELLAGEIDRVLDHSVPRALAATRRQWRAGEARDHRQGARPRPEILRAEPLAQRVAQ